MRAWRLLRATAALTAALNLGDFAPKSAFCAAEDPEAEIARGIELRRAGDDEGARRAFERAYSVHPTPRAAAQIGLAEFALGRWAESSEHLTEALRATHDAWIRKNRQTLEDSLAEVRSHVGRLEIVGEPSGAELPSMVVV